MIAPFSTKDLEADIKVSYLKAGEAAIKAIKNLFTGEKEKLNANIYANFFITNIQIARVE